MGDLTNLNIRTSGSGPEIQLIDPASGESFTLNKVTGVVSPTGAGGVMRPRHLMSAARSRVQAPINDLDHFLDRMNKVYSSGDLGVLNRKKRFMID